MREARATRQGLSRRQFSQCPREVEGFGLDKRGKVDDRRITTSDRTGGGPELGGIFPKGMKDEPNVSPHVSEAAVVFGEVPPDGERVIRLVV